jgi:hypothetical protein
MEAPVICLTAAASAGSIVMDGLLQSGLEVWATTALKKVSLAGSQAHKFLEQEKMERNESSITR